MRRVQKTPGGTDGEAEEAPLKLINKLVITNRNPNGDAKRLCTQLRKMLDPECLTHLKEKHPRLKDCLMMADHYLISHIVVVTGSEMQVGVRPTGATYSFKILEYEDNFKNYGPEFYKAPAFVTFEGRSPLRSLFEKFGRNEAGFRRSLHFCFEGDKIFVRHYWYRTEDTDENFRVGLREIGPRLTLQLTGIEEGLYPGLRKDATKSSKRNEKEVG